MEFFAALGELCWQIGRMTFFIILGLFAANIIESLNWGDRLAVIARPLIRLGHLSTITGASFSLAFFSGVSANAMLAEAYDQKQINKRELILTNLFNSLPRFFLHLPTVFFLTLPFLKLGAILYVGLTFSVAVLQSGAVVIAGRILLPRNTLSKGDHTAREPVTFKEAVAKSIAHSKRKIVRIVKFMVPVYLLFFFAGRVGFFAEFNRVLTEHLPFAHWIKPEALGIIALHITTEFSAGLTAGAALLADHSLSIKEVVLALLIGNILASPIRAARHQLPYYTGIYPAKMALALVAISQGSRTLCIALVTILYYCIG